MIPQQLNLFTGVHPVQNAINRLTKKIDLNRNRTREIESFSIKSYFKEKGIRL